MQLTAPVTRPGSINPCDGSASVGRVELKPRSVLDGIQCFVLPGRCPLNFRHVEFYAKTYAFWKGVYTDLYQKSGRPESLCTDSYYRQDHVFSLVHQQDVIGCILCSYHNTQVPTPFDLNYFADLSDEMMGAVRKALAGKLMLMESLTVHPDWRRSSKGLPVADLLLGLAMRAFLASHCDVLVGTPRVDVKMHTKCSMFGGRCLGDIQKSGFSCQSFLFLSTEDHKHPSPDVQGFIDRLWDSRTKTTEDP